MLKYHPYCKRKHRDNIKVPVPTKKKKKVLKTSRSSIYVKNHVIRNVWKWKIIGKKIHLEIELNCEDIYWELEEL